MLGPHGPDTPIYRILGRVQHGTALEGGAMGRRLKAAQKRAGTGGWTWHDLRRTAARQIYAATGDLRDAKDLLGHRHLSTTLIYLHAGHAPLPSSKLALCASGNGLPDAR
jgi:site-specific recombinase XerC